MKPTGPGKIEALPTNWHWEDNTQFAEPTLRLYNFDVDSSELKQAHMEFLNKQVVFFLDDNPGARVTVVGSASLTGESDHNVMLSEKRAKAVTDFFVSKGIAASKFKPGGPFGIGDASASPSKEDERDRSVTLWLRFPLKIEDIRLRTDDWKNQLGWDDIVGLDREDDGTPIKKINIQVTASGAPKSWNLADSGPVLVMPPNMPVRLRSHPPKPELGMGYPTILARKGLSIPMKDPDLPLVDARTLYRLGHPIDQAGDFMKASGDFSEVATVVQPSGVSDAAFRAALQWATRGVAKQNDSRSERDESPDAKRLLQAGGVEVLEIEALGKADPNKGILKQLIRNPADVFYYAGASNDDGCLALQQSGWTTKKPECWLSPEELQNCWSPPFDLKVLILAGCPVLTLPRKQTPLGSIPTSGGPWSALLKPTGPLTAILGYKDKAPLDNPTGKKIAERMGRATPDGGLGDKDWVPTWLEINAEYRDGHNTWNAVGMDAAGYTEIVEPKSSMYSTKDYEFKTWPLRIPN
jgi:hypothetical protein